MTSVPNRLLPLNGNNVILCLLLLLSLCSCGTTKTTTKPPPAPTTTDADKVRIYDPASGKYILVPRDAVKVDTIKWTEETTTPVIVHKSETPEMPDKKSSYEVSLFLPLNSLNYPEFYGQVDQKLLRFMQYYGGMRIAAQEIERSGLPITFHSYDTESSYLKITEILKDPQVRKADVIIGPYDKENIEAVASFGLLNEKIVISPWLPAFSVDKNNPYFLQMVPGLNSNAAAIMKYAGEAFRNKKIFLVARNNPAEIHRLQMFKKNPAIKTEDLIIDDASIDLAKTNLSFLLDDPDGTVFIMPYYAKSDEQFVSNFLRKLHADKGTKNVIVFGLPQWTGFSSLNSNYLESLAVHISSPTYVDTSNPAYRSFRDKFYRTYFTMPDNQAYQGYDMMMWVARQLVEGGMKGLVNRESNFGIISGYDLQPIYAAETTSPIDKKTPMYYENGKLRILKYVNQDFELVR
ncbi:MAG: ABC transporter substrate-binding protein [Bacteroidota bacterium]|nr:ABC transporter substrate-binding protein [Bacteroidota bacterium]